MANTFKFGNGEWAVGKETALAYNSENNNFKPLPFTFDRGSTATVVNKDGLIETVGVDEPRIDFLNNTKGHLLLEPERRNLFNYSEEFSNSVWAKTRTNITSNVAVSPDGTQNADELSLNSNNNTHYFLQDRTTTNQEYTQTIFIKDNGARYFQITGSTGFASYWVNFDIQEGVITRNNDNVDATIENYGNNWYRIGVTLISSGAPASRIIFAIINEPLADRLPSFTGVSSESFYIWGAQLEEGSYQTSYIPTSGSAVTRVLDNIIQVTPNLSNSQEVTAFIDLGARPLTGSNSTADAIEFFFGSGNRIVYNQNGSSKHRIEINTDGSSTRNYFSTDTFSTTSIKIAIAVTQSNLRIYTNRGDLWNTNIEGVADWSNLSVVKTTISQSIGNIKINDLRFYNTALSDSELQALTT